jgi:hypothetical protein
MLTYIHGLGTTQAPQRYATDGSDISNMCVCVREGGEGAGHTRYDGSMRVLVEGERSGLS